MLLIKVLSLILIFPSLFVVHKLIQKKDLNFFDLLLIFNTLYFAIIPLKSNEVVFDSIGRLSERTSIFVFIYLLFFFVSLLIASNLSIKESDSPLNVTRFLKNLYELKVTLYFKILLIILPIFSLIYYVPQVSIISAFGEIQDTNANISYEQSSMVKFFGTIFKLGITITIVLFFQIIKKKKFDVLIAISLLLFLVNLLLLPRRTLLVFFLFAAIVFYSTNRELINKKMMMYALGFAAFMYFIYFPFYNIIRHSPVKVDLQDPISSISEIYDYGITSFSDADKNSSVRTDDRALGLYRAVYWLMDYDSEKEITWGRITLAAIDHAIPKVVNPSKGQGSEILLQERMNTKKDSADSVLLLALADYSMFGGIFTVIVYLLVYKIWFLIAGCSEFFFGKTIVSLYIVFFLFDTAFSIERKLDGILANTVSYFLVIVVIVLVHRLNFITLLQREH
ncbi:hypothetical protein [Maribacter arenosus]|uniref:Oligosaccharide repeat unit polymerase n=1 Tax=Maribacter arenosus TaxID=1854708 RepID=A0ABR7VAT5_9FLAO|nr:hypothetical protein [Maribacter arenosus]MBD0850778.1 hypothetical protein [Maribacter arenosus]